jgi:glutathione peroxidase
LSRVAGGELAHYKDAVSLYSLSVRALDGSPASLSAYSGQVTLVVNVASECGFTPQYRGLQSLHERFKARGFSVLGFPSNDFGRQEPGSAQQIRAFCDRTYGVTFPLFEKVVTRSGPEQSPVYAELARESGELPAWNFAKYLVGKDGKVVAFFEPKVKPEDAQLVAAIETALTRTG